MMAKMFYTLDEAKAALGKNEEDIKQYAREGKLREFRDGPRLMFKADQIDALRAELGSGGGGDRIDLGPSDSGAPIGLVDSRSASGTGISLMDSDAGPAGSRPGMVQPLKDDTALAADLGLSGSMGGVPSPGRPGGTMSGTGMGMSGSKGGINVFGEDSIAHADPMAQTAISQGVDSVNLEGVGSGSGLLDLTRESDDTSLGAELLDEIAPGKTRAGVAAGESGGAGTGVAAAISDTRGGRAFGAVTYVETRDPSAGFFGGMALAAALFTLLGGLVLTAGVMGTKPALVGQLSGYSIWVLFGIGVGLAVVFGVVGLIVGRAAR